MKIAIVNKSELNACWSPYQYTNQCHTCDKVEACKVKSNEHQNGINNHFKNKQERIKKSFIDSLKKLARDKTTALKMFS